MIGLVLKWQDKTKVENVKVLGRYLRSLDETVSQQKSQNLLFYFIHLHAT